MGGYLSGSRTLQAEYNLRKAKMLARKKLMQNLDEFGHVK